MSVKGATTVCVLPGRPTLSLHGRLGVPHRLPGAGDVQEDGVRHARHAEAVFAHVLVPDGDQVVHPVLLELLGRLLGPLLVELHRVQVASGGDGAQYGVGEGAAARPCGTRTARGVVLRRRLRNRSPRDLYQ